MDERDRGDVVRSGAHEIGHTGGLTHPKPSASQAGKDNDGNKLNSDNLMLQNSSQKNVTPEQLEKINQ